MLLGGPATGKSHLATAIGAAGITRHSKRVRLYSVVGSVNALEQEKAQRRARAHRSDPAAHGRCGPRRAGLAALQLLGWRPAVSTARLYEHTSASRPTLDFADWSTGLGDATVTTALLDRLTHDCHTLETGNESIRFTRSTATAKKRAKERERGLGNGLH